MLFSLFVAQRELSLRHYDVKLLNFFLGKPPTPDGAEPLGAGEPVALRYGCLGADYEFEMRADEPGLVMLADFGTADIAPGARAIPPQPCPLPRCRRRSAR